MRLQNENSVEPAKCHGIEQVTDFSINVSAQAFSILSSGLYKDPIRAIIRELSTNAVDSHQEARTSKKPFDVEFPTKFNPIFRIRDYGTGLSKNNVLGLYSTYFSSTKTDSNEQIGALGLGSKSPLGYTNSFSVVSYFEDMKTSFSIFIGDNGFPNIAVTGKKESNEPVGLEIIVPVKEESYYMSKWYNNAKEIYAYFDVVPNIMGAEIEIEKPTYSRIIGNIKIHESSDKRNIIQGNISYPLDMNSLDMTNEEVNIIDKVGFDIYLNIGEASFLPNREELSYDEKTKKNIHKAINVFILNLKKDIKKSIKKISNLNNAVSTFNDIVKNYSVLIKNSSDLRDMLLKKMSRWDNYLDVTINIGYRASTLLYKIKNTYKTLDDKFDRVVYYRDGKRSKIKSSYVSTEHDMVFWINDTDKPIITKFGRGITDKNYNILIPDVEDVEATTKFLRRKLKITNKQIRFVSEVEFPNTTKKKLEGTRVNRMRTVTSGYRYNNRKSWRWQRSLKLDRVDVAERVFVWVEVKGYQSLNHIKNEDYSFVDFLGNATDKPLWDVKSIYGVKTVDVDEVKSKPNWIHIDDYVKRTIKDYINEHISSDITYTISGLEDMIKFSRKVDINRINNVEIQSIVHLLKNVSGKEENVTVKIEQWIRALGIENLSEINIDFDEKIVYNDGMMLKDFIKEKYNHLYIINDINYYNVTDEVYSLINDLY